MLVDSAALGKITYTFQKLRCDYYTAIY